MYAFITGATSGIGKEMALLLAKDGYNLILTARNEAQLELLKTQLTKAYHIDVIIHPMDLTELVSGADMEGVSQTTQALLKLLNSHPPYVSILSAGAGIVGDFCNASFSSEKNILELNIVSIVVLNHILLDIMPEGYLMNIGSIAGFQPAPFQAIYAASKAFVNTFTLSIQKELKHTGHLVNISLLAPGPVATDFDRRAGVTTARSGMSPQKCAKRALKQMFAGKKLIFPSTITRLAYYASKFLPLSLITHLELYIQKKKL